MKAKIQFESFSDTVMAEALTRGYECIEFLWLSYGAKFNGSEYTLEYFKEIFKSYNVRVKSINIKSLD